MRRLIHLFFLFSILSMPANAEIERTAELCEQEICLHWWPVLAPVEGWHHDRQYSNFYNVNAQAPDGYTFADAETVIYAMALYKERIPETKTVEMLIEDDIKRFLSRDPSIMVTEAEPQKTADGQVLKSFTFFPKEKGNWEQVSYGEEGDFYLTFAVSSRTKEGFTQALGAYKQFIGRYKETP